MFIRTRENYREVFKSIVGLKPDLRIFVLTLFNTGGRDLPGARDLFSNQIQNYKNRDCETKAHFNLRKDGICTRCVVTVFAIVPTLCEPMGSFELRLPQQ